MRIHQISFCLCCKSFLRGKEVRCAIICKRHVAQNGALEENSSICHPPPEAIGGKLFSLEVIQIPPEGW